MCFDDFEGRNTDDYGLLPRSFHYLFHLMRQKPNTGYRIAASYLEIYNEQVVDLLNPNQRKALAVRWSKNKGFYVENLFTVECESIDDLMAVLEEVLFATSIVKLGVERETLTKD
ncbi:hypothetical protein LSH36_15g04005 [Paralvinella palmiformis]|uniref:Kinesin motor domain-containing protein n=1 Tax=Paralvinella palmiformis TaxID=53620 RepID=A0AAD9KCJ5_9ANNE|nr:hypothetical protein LSH36_15g04005 [Paralvinella palmiformis]